MSFSFELSMQPREALGTAASRRLRRLEAKVPVVLYGQQESIALSIDHSALSRLLEDDRFYSAILNIKVGEITYQAVIKGIKRDPVKPKILDVEFMRIDSSTPLSISVPLHFTGENVAPGIKQGGGSVSYQLTNVKLQCLPKDIPDEIVVDISRLGLSEPVRLSQLTLPEGVKLAKGEDRVVVTILAPRGQSATASTE